MITDLEPDILECEVKWALESITTLCHPMDCSLPGSSIRGIFQATVLEWGAIAFSENGCRVQQIYIGFPLFLPSLLSYKAPKAEAPKAADIVLGDQAQIGPTS